MEKAVNIHTASTADVGNYVFQTHFKRERLTAVQLLPDICLQGQSSGTALDRQLWNGKIIILAQSPQYNLEFIYSFKNRAETQVHVQYSRGKLILLQESRLATLPSFGNDPDAINTQI